MSHWHPERSRSSVSISVREVRSGIRAGFATTASEAASNAMGFGADFSWRERSPTAELAAQTAGNLRRIVESGTFGFSRN